MYMRTIFQIFFQEFLAKVITVIGTILKIELSAENFE